MFAAERGGNPPSELLGNTFFSLAELNSKPSCGVHTDAIERLYDCPLLREEGDFIGGLLNSVTRLAAEFWIPENSQTLERDTGIKGPLEFLFQASFVPMNDAGSRLINDDVPIFQTPKPQNPSDHGLSI